MRWNEEKYPPGSLVSPNMKSALGGNPAGMQGMSPQELLAQMGQPQSILTEKQLDELSMAQQELRWIDQPDKHHYLCPKCSRKFINNISCPRCGWRLER